jgi:hypothetical protein
MDAKRGSSSQDPAPDSREDVVERFGPLALRRLVKDDGRSLIVYERAQPPERREPDPAQ